MDHLNCQDVLVRHPPCWDEKHQHVARLVEAVKRGIEGSGCWVEVWNGKRWTYLEHQTSGVFIIGKLTPLHDDQLRAFGIPSEEFPSNYDVTDRRKRWDERFKIAIS